MKKKIVIGEKMTKKGLVVLWCYYSIFGIMAAVGIFNVFRIYFNVSTMINWIVSILIFMAVLAFITPVFASNEVLEFTDQYISYYHVRGYFNQLKEVIRILKNDREVADIFMKTIDIAKINLSYVSHIEGWAQKGYKLKLTFLLKDGTTFSIFPTTIGQMEKGDYEAAFQLLEDNHVEIVDKLGLRKYLNMSSYDFQKYIQSIEEGKEK